MNGPQIEFVDLGLSVKWGKSLLGATNGDTVESWYGNYYAWGEIETKDVYDWTTYKYANGSMNTLTKYCNKAEYGDEGYTDQLTQLDGDDDAATQTNSAWRMPTKAELEELIALPNTWVTDYNKIPGLNGRVFTGKNGNTLFIPAGGYHYGSNFGNARSYCYLWSSSLNLDNPNYAYYLLFNSDNIRMSYDRRCYGYIICPIL